MKGEILGIPLALIIMVLFLVALIDVPMVLLHASTAKRITAIEKQEVETRKMLLTSPTPTIVPVSVTPTPTIKPVVRSATTSGQVK